MNIEAIKAKIKSVPPMTWVIVAGVVLAAFFLLRSKGSSSAGGVVGGGGGGGDTISGGDVPGQDVVPLPTPNPTPTPTPTPTPAVKNFMLSITGKTNLLDAKGKLLGHGSSGTYAATIVHIGGKAFYRFKRKNAKGVLQWTFIPVGAKTIKVKPATSAVVVASPAKANLAFLPGTDIFKQGVGILPSKRLMGHSLPGRPTSDLPTPMEPWLQKGLRIVS